MRRRCGGGARGGWGVQVRYREVVRKIWNFQKEVFFFFFFLRF